MIGHTWVPTELIRTLKYFLLDNTKQKERLHQVDFIWAFLQVNVKHRVFKKLDSRYVEYLPEYANYFGRPLRLKKSTCGMNNSGKLFADDVTNWLIDESGFNHSKCKMSIYYKYAPDGSKLVVLSYVDDCVYWYTSEELGNWFVDSIGNIFHVKLLGYPHWFMSIRISQLREHYISVDQDIYATSIVTKYLDTDTIK